MTLRGTAAHQRTSQGWRRSGDESYWESLLSEGDAVPRVPRTNRVPRPQSAIEGGQMDKWILELKRMQRGHPRPPVHDQALPFNDRAGSASAFSKEPGRPAPRQQGMPSFYGRDFSFGGTPSLYESSLGSQESILTLVSAAPERRTSVERAHITQAPKKEKAKLSFLSPIKIGWLPTQRRVMLTDAHSRSPENDASQVKLKQPITPTIEKNAEKSNGSRHLKGHVEKRQFCPNGLAVRSWQAPEAPEVVSPSSEQVADKINTATQETKRPLTWYSLRRGWGFNKSPAGGQSQSNEQPARSSTDYTGKAPLIKTYSTDPCKSNWSLFKTTSVQPIRSTTSPADGISQPTHVKTTSALTTLIPQTKVGISSITISSKKVTGSIILPAPTNPTCYSGQAKAFPTPASSAQHPMDPNAKPNHVTLQRKATIVKVTEHRVTSSPVTCRKSLQSPLCNPPVNNDTVVHRRKATIIKVTEHRESYTPATAGSRTRHPEYRHSYTEGAFREKSMWLQGCYESPEHSITPSHHYLQSPERTNYTQTTNTATTVALRIPERNDGEVHRSTLNLVLSNPPAVASPADPSLRPPQVGSSRSYRRPLSCYGNVFGHAETSKENLTQPAVTRKWSFGLPRETKNNPAASESGFSCPGTAARETGHLWAAALPKPNTEGIKTVTPPQDAARRPSLTLIKAPDPNSQQSAEEVLALNAAKIIANIKLHRQLSKKKTPNGDSGKDSTAPPQRSAARDLEEDQKPKPSPTPFQPDADTAPLHPALAEFAPMSAGFHPKQPPSISLQEALEKSRPDFISRSRRRVREMERRAQQRREPLGSKGPWSAAGVKTDNLFKPSDGAITGREMQPRTRRCHLTAAEAKRKREEERRREVCLTNRQRAELFKKRLLDQILQRGHN